MKSCFLFLVFICLPLFFFAQNQQQRTSMVGLCGITGGNITQGKFTHCPQLTILDSQYKYWKITHFTFVASPKNGNAYFEPISGNKLTSSALQQVEFMADGGLVIITEVKIEKDGNNKQVPGPTFNILKSRIAYKHSDKGETAISLSGVSDRYINKHFIAHYPNVVILSIPDTIQNIKVKVFTISLVHADSTVMLQMKVPVKPTISMNVKGNKLPKKILSQILEMKSGDIIQLSNVVLSNGTVCPGRNYIVM